MEVVVTPKTQNHDDAALLQDFFNFIPKSHYALLPVTSDKQQEIISQLFSNKNKTQNPVDLPEAYASNIIMLSDKNARDKANKIIFKRFYEGRLPSPKAIDVLQMLRGQNVFFSENPYGAKMWEIRDLDSPIQGISGGSRAWELALRNIYITGKSKSQISATLLIDSDGDIGEIYRRVTGKEHPYIKSNPSKHLKKWLQ